MSFQSGSVSFRAFRILKKVPEGFRDLYGDQIGRWALVERLDARTKDPNSGWCYFADIGRTALGSLNDWLFDHYVVLGMRMDEKRVDSKQLKIRLDEKVRETMLERGLVRMGTRHKAEIKDALEEELLKKQAPSSKNFELVWDIHARRALVFTTSDKPLTQMQNLFYETFLLRLWPDRPYDWLVDHFGWDTAQAMCQPFSRRAVEPTPPDPTVDPGEDPLAGMNQLLTADFISWLWYRGANSGSFEVKAGAVDLWVDDKVSLANEKGKLTIVGESAPTDEETVRGLAAGKKPVEVRFGLRRGEAEWFFTIKAAGHGPELKSVKLPIFVKEGDEEIIYERAFLIDALEQIIHELWCQFFQSRIGDDWASVEGWLLTQETEETQDAAELAAFPSSPAIDRTGEITREVGQASATHRRAGSRQEEGLRALNRLLAEDRASVQISVGKSGNTAKDAAPGATVSDDDLDVPV